MYGVPKIAIDQLTSVDPGAFSALTIFIGTFRIIIENSSHFEGRIANSLAHELSHVILEHEPQDHFLDGSRRWDATMEREADWLAGELLVPEEAALRIVRSGRDVQIVAVELGVSVRLLEWRLNHSGARKRVARECAARGGRRSWGRPP